MEKKNLQYTAPRTRVVKLGTEQMLMAASGYSVAQTFTVSRSGYGSALDLSLN